ncbi:uncharacterized protein LOC105835581 [Monomorium pharaonis]|uniref:uncharacterized protein LOC105835581 n=1 Tax=Monomorium pharaonis TaxID=307658 RepID=UPI00063FD31D|nr:uncharacterized protein LOC105835581 [Monomorium pharaonis]
MLNNITKNILLCSRSALLQRYNVLRVTPNIRSKWNTVSSKNQNVTLEDDDIDDQPIKYSTSKAATMRVDEYRNPDGDNIPWYQDYCMTISMAVFLIYFCILREENDLDEMLNTDLGDSLRRTQKEMEKKKT